MASIILSGVGNVIGSGIGGAIGASIGQFAGKLAGSFIEQNLFGSHQSISTQGRRLSDLMVQSSAYGEMINILFGNVLIAGNIIWATNIKESTHVKRQTRGRKGSKVTHTHTSYTYSISIAIALCEGVISSINKIIADGRVLDPTCYNIRIHRGTEHQTPDPLIESIEGIGKTPAYRGMAYIVFENLELSQFENRIPNFTFEVKKEIADNTDIERVENLIESVVIIPGCGEFVYDTTIQQKFEADYYDKKWIQRGLRKTINQNNLSGKTDAVLALEQLHQTLPNVKWVAPVVSWFSSSLDIHNAVIKPGVEYKGNVMTTPCEWKVKDFDRKFAHLITQKEERAIYGGTPSDQSIIRYLDEMKSRNLKIMFYPMLLIDTPNKPWRGHLSGKAEHIHAFFNKPLGYNRFILHYAHLVKGKVDAFIIGSELTNLNALTTSDHQFPSVKELISLAQQVKAILGANVKVSYAADWSEYHHTNGGWHHLDPLWASNYIDFIGIDAYFPLTNQKYSEYDVNKLIAAWESGEGYDFYYTDSNKKEGKMPLSPEWAWKNIKYWWENEHIDPNGTKTPWVPKSKKIWFTEYGFPSIACASNQPNVFYDPSTLESNIPIHSDATADLFAQRSAIYATEKKWQNSEMIERKFLWTWDARPYPYWPNLTDVWADGGCWLKGHWVQGKLGLSTLAQVILDLLQRTNLKPYDIDVSQLNQPIEGLCITQPTNIKKAMQILQQAYFFDIVEHNKRLTFLPRKNKKVYNINHQDLVPIKYSHDQEHVLNIKRVYESELPQFINVNFFNKYRDFQVSTVNAQRHHTSSHEKNTINLPIITNEHHAQEIADINLYANWLEQMQYNFILPLKYAFLLPGNLVAIEVKQEKHLIRITNTQFGKNRALKVEGVAENLELYDMNHIHAIDTINVLNNQISETHCEILDIPLISQEEITPSGRVLIACCPLSDNWSGAIIYTQENSELKEIAQVINQATMGTTTNSLIPDHCPELIDYQSKIIVNIIGGTLQSISKEALINYGNLAIIGDEIVQFQHARLIAEHQYELSCFLRGRFGTEEKINTHILGERFVLLNDALESVPLPNQSIGISCQIKAISFGHTEEHNTQSIPFTYQANSLKPYSPSHVKLSGNKLEWVRRTRGVGELKNHVDVALNEEKEQYIVEFQDNNITKQFITSSTYLTLHKSILDMLKKPKVKIIVSQISQVVGKGNSTLIRPLNKE